MKISLFEQNSTQYSVKEIATIIKNQLGFGGKIYKESDTVQRLEMVLDALQKIVVKIRFNVLDEDPEDGKDFSDRKIVYIESFILYLNNEIDVTETAVSLMATSSAIESTQQILKILQDADISNALA